MAKILDKLIFKDFEEMVENLNKEELGFKDKTKREIIETYKRIYKERDMKKYGVVAFRLKVL